MGVLFYGYRADECCSTNQTVGSQLTGGMPVELRPGAENVDPTLRLRNLSQDKGV